MELFKSDIFISISGIGVNSPHWDSRDVFLGMLYNGRVKTSSPVITPGTTPQDRLLRAIDAALADAGQPKGYQTLVSSFAPGAAQLAANWLNRRADLAKPALSFSNGQAGLVPALKEAAQLLKEDPAAPVVLSTIEKDRSGDWLALAVVLQSSGNPLKQVYARLANPSTTTSPKMLTLCLPEDEKHATPLVAELHALIHSSEPTSCCFTPVAGSSLEGLIRNSLCMYHRFYPAVDGWEGPQAVQGWQDSPFFVPVESMPWFVCPEQPERAATLVCLSALNDHLALTLTSPEDNSIRPNSILVDSPVNLVLCSGASMEELFTCLANLEADSADQPSLTTLSRASYDQAQRHSGSSYTLSLVANSPAGLVREIEYARKGLPRAFESSGEWQTPAGSYFTALPLGPDGQVAFVYPGAFNSFIGLGRDLLHLFPNIYPHFANQTADMGQLLQERALYPRSLDRLSTHDLDEREAQLNGDPVAMLVSGASLAVLYTLVMREVFKVQPGQAFGYSLGECSMLFALQAWSGGDTGRFNLGNSPLFRSRLSGPKETLREQWHLPAPDQDPPEGIWTNLLLMTTPDAVRAVLPDEPRVFLTHINTPRQVVIAGDPAACQRVVHRLKCPALKAPFEQVLHCQPVRADYD
ncbi:MAG: hypothetical protein PHQ40_18845, partial [Anaerolineaceae bacterium]|nr:hypothetical protein [Anaerolineaceae bacterium]